MERSAAGVTPLHPAIHKMVRRIVARFHPEQVILFGSYATGKAGPDSDADLLIVMEVEGRKRPKVVEMYGEIGAVGLAKDLILVTPEELERRKDDIGSIVYRAIREGKVLYDRSGQRAKPSGMG